MARGFFLTMLFCLCAFPAAALEHIVFATDWKAQAEHGGFYQAILSKEGLVLRKIILSWVAP